ncbi:3-oxoadipate enol-lactonase [Shimia abyssi]|uniref:3-oxoadipate enol-lactonase n=1 Tax=Shimia abyssi TaxID=1662395 RepID=A0A2P8FE54_9RHOB|nr:3-oxoadipate enol-lactonase [Shimia abyssi]PSL19993.1 3-oxoadipate enol-lactonase [Shimia abyssi]
MRVAEFDGTRLHFRVDGDLTGAPVLFINSLGTDLRLWDPILPFLPAGLRIIRYDKRGHGLSDAPPAPYSMGTLVRDAEQLLDMLDVRDAMVVGLSIGGMIAQGLAVKRLDLVRALVLSNTGAKIATREIWDTRIDTARRDGVAALAQGTMERWFSREFLDRPELALWQNMFEQTSLDGFTGCSAAIRGTDFYTPTSGLRLPTLGIGGSEDGGTPPDLVRETVDLIPGSRFELIRRAGHLPCVERPETYAAMLTDFFTETGHV